MPSKSWRYELLLVSIVCAGNGLMSFDQATAWFLMPFIQPALGLDNTQIGMLSASYWGVFAISSYGISAFAEARGKLKIAFIIVMILLSVCSTFSGFATSFAGLLMTRLLIGFIEGPFLPVGQSIIALETPESRRGTYLGIVGTGGNVLGLFVAPMLLVALSNLYGWRSGFFVVLVPGLICTALAAFFVREPARREVAPPDGSAASAGGGLRETLGFRNIWLCIVICCLFVGGAGLGGAFLPLFYVNVRHFTSQEMSVLMALVGLASVIFALVIPIISDFTGRKAAMVVANALGVLCPLAAIYYKDSMIVLGILTFVGSIVLGTVSLVMGTIPSESVPARSMSAAMGLIVALGVLGGGVAGPAIGGWAADHWGLTAPLLLQAGCAAASALCSTALRETAPGKIRTRDTRLTA